MKNINHQKIVNSKIYDIVKQMLKNRIDLLEGCHKITSLSYQLNDPDRIFLFFRGIASETEHFPFGKIRNTCSPKHLTDLDIEKEKYLILVKEDILNTCRKVKQTMTR